MKPVKVIWNGKRLKDIFPHATPWQLFKYRVGKFIRKVIIVAVVVGLVYLTYIIVAEFKAVKYTAEDRSNIVMDQTTDNELDRIMEEKNFKAVTILRARKVASDSKMKLENIKHEDIVKQEKTRHDAILAQIEAENEAIRSEELALVGSPSLK